MGEFERKENVYAEKVLFRNSLLRGIQCEGAVRRGREGARRRQAREARLVAAAAATRRALIFSSFIHCLFIIELILCFTFYLYAYRHFS